VAQQDHVLVVDDDTTLTGVLRRKLTRAGFAVSEAFDGQDAWELLQKEPIDFVIVDEKMPKVNGSELCQRIRQEPRLKELPILMITGKLLELDRERLRERFRLIDIIGKPFSPRAVLRTVATHLSRIPAAT